MINLRVDSDGRHIFTITSNESKPTGVVNGVAQVTLGDALIIAGSDSYAVEIFNGTTWVPKASASSQGVVK